MHRYKQDAPPRTTITSRDCEAPAEGRPVHRPTTGETATLPLLSRYWPGELISADDLDAAVVLVKNHPFVARGGSLQVSEAVAP
jgi:hypothetical protein